MKMHGLFIVVDGPSGSGKNSIISQLIKDLGNINIKAVSLEETKERNYDRKKILEVRQKGDKEVTKTIINARKKLYQGRVIPELLKNFIVIANRGEPTTLGYQTLRQEITMDDIWNIHRNEGIPIPDLVVIINCSIEEAIRRESLRKFSKEEKDKNSMSGKFTKNDFAERRKIHANYERVRKFLENWKSKFSHHPYIPLEKRKTFHIEDDYPDGLKKEVKGIFSAPGFFKNLDIISGGKEALIKMQQLGHSVFICTSPISKYENCVLEKYQWVENNLGYEWTKKIIMTKDKTLIFGDILIDDKPEHTGLKKPAWKHALFETPYNQHVKTKLRITWSNWEKILE